MHLVKKAGWDAHPALFSLGEEIVMELTIAGVIKESIVDGPGIRYTVFTQ